MNAFITELRVTLSYFNTVPNMSEIMLITSSSYCEIQLNFIECNVIFNDLEYRLTDQKFSLCQKFGLKIAFYGIKLNFKFR